MAKRHADRSTMVEYTEPRPCPALPRNTRTGWYEAESRKLSLH